jgi:hypothetical protein
MILDLSHKGQRRLGKDTKLSVNELNDAAAVPSK